jgi:hypothetical protein
VTTTGKDTHLPPHVQRLQKPSCVRVLELKLHRALFLLLHADANLRDRVHLYRDRGRGSPGPADLEALYAEESHLDRGEHAVLYRV